MKSERSVYADEDDNNNNYKKRLGSGVYRYVNLGHKLFFHHFFIAPLLPIYFDSAYFDTFKLFLELICVFYSLFL